MELVWARTLTLAPGYRDPNVVYISIYVFPRSVHIYMSFSDQNVLYLHYIIVALLPTNCLCSSHYLSISALNYFSHNLFFNTGCLLTKANADSGLQCSGGYMQCFFSSTLKKTMPYIRRPQRRLIIIFRETNITCIHTHQSNRIDIS